jgi:outer membrane autotransporter protein
VGLQAGIDFPVLLGPQSAFILGVLGGYMNSTVAFKNSTTNSNATYRGGTVGAYATFLHGGFFADLLFKADLLDMKFNNDVLGANSANIANYGAHLDVGYRFPVWATAFVEPLASVEYVRSEFGNLVVPGSVVRFGNDDTTRGRLGLRFGATSNFGTVRVEPSVTGSVWHRFSGDNPATVTSAGVGFGFTDRTTDKTYGEVGAMLNIFAGNASGFVKADVRFGEKLFGAGGKIGVRYQW